MDYIKITNLKKEIKNNIVLNNINISIEKGLIYGFWGRNGSGKTLLFKSICGLIKPSSGEIYINDQILGENIEFPNSCGILIDGPGYWPNKTAFENLKSLSMINNTDVSDNEILLLLNSVGFNDHLKKSFKELSLGFKQKFGIAQSLLGNPELLILDEPFNAIDEESIEEIYDILLSHKNLGSTILISSHDKEEIKRVCDYIYLLKDGQVVELINSKDF